jgi:hypothetical protein
LSNHDEGLFDKNTKKDKKLFESALQFNRKAKDNKKRTEVRAKIRLSFRSFKTFSFLVSIIMKEESEIKNPRVIIILSGKRKSGKDHLAGLLDRL